MFSREEDDISKTVYDHGLKRRLESGSSHSPLLRKSQIKKYLQDELTKDEPEPSKANFIGSQSEQDGGNGFYAHKGSLKSKELFRSHLIL